MSGMTDYSYNHDLFQQSFSLTQELLSELLSDCANLPYPGPGSRITWHKKLSRLTNEVSQFVEITTLLTRAVSKRGEGVSMEIKSSHIKLLFIMKAISQAQTKNDFIALEDLIKHELKDNLTQWKIDLIPRLKKLLN
jgi:hypothetical protein